MSKMVTFEDLATEVEREVNEIFRVGGWLNVCPLAENCAVARTKQAFEYICSQNYQTCVNYRDKHPLSEEEFEIKLSKQGV